VYYDLAKVAVNRLAFSQGHELAAYGGIAVAITPGWLRSEMMLDAFGVTEDDWRAALAGPSPAPAGFAASESPRYVAARSRRSRPTPSGKRWNRRSVTSAEMAREYGFTDIDGTQPDSWALH
jgi:NAD(P)-dependent dehydrogenase (short-subunit alcohol dehydrogenase family)